MRWIVRRGKDRHEVQVEKLAGGRLRVIFGGVDVELEARLEGDRLELRREDGRTDAVLLSRVQEVLHLGLDPEQLIVTVQTPVAAALADQAAASKGAGHLEAPIPGKVLKVLVEAGQVVEAEQPLLVLEAMKMENELVAEAAGKVTRVHVSAGDTVEGGAPLIDMEAIED